MNINGSHNASCIFKAQTNPFDVNLLFIIRKCTFFPVILQKEVQTNIFTVNHFCEFVVSVSIMEKPKSEEDLEVSDDQANRESSENVSLIQKIKHILSQVTVEPVVFFHYLAFAITLVSQNQMIVYKTCRGLIYYNHDIIIYLCFAWNEKRKSTI